MTLLSVLIPARNEIFLQRTIDDVLDNARGDTEVIAVCDGYKPELRERKGLRIIHNETSIGQRQATNQAARVSTAKYVMKLDAHCAVDEGFDVKLASDCEYDWTVLPVMRHLNAFRWVCSCGQTFPQGPEPKCHDVKMDVVWQVRQGRAKSVEFMFIDPELRARYFDGKSKREYEWTDHYAKHAKGDLCDVMVGMGPGWFMHRDRYWELGGMDENHGSYGQMGVEVALKAWLSGGRHVVNRKTWFAHLFRTQPGFSWPYPITGKEYDHARNYSRDLWLNDKWPGAKRPFSWVLEHFAPVPGWPLVAKKDLTILYYTHSRTAEPFASNVRDRLRELAGGIPIISVSQKPLDFGTNICVGDIGQSLQNVYKQVLIGAKAATTPYVALCEDDCLYTSEHLAWRPPLNKFGYNLNRWLLHNDTEEHAFTYRRRPILSQCIAPRQLLIDCLSQREGRKIPDQYCGEMGLFEKQLGLPEYSHETFETKQPNVVVCHKQNTSGRKYWGKDAEPRHTLEPWGEAEHILQTLGLQEGDPEMAKFGRGSWKRWQHSYIGSIIFGMDEIMGQLMDFADRRRPGRAERRQKTLPPFVSKIADGSIAKTIGDAELRDQPWYGYLKELYGNWSGKKRDARVLEIMRETINLYEDIKDHGLKSPLDMWREGKDRLVLHRGWRRLIIMNELHRRGMRDFSRVPIRVFKDIHVFRAYNPSPAWAAGPVGDNSIHGLATRQFCEMGVFATDKYWVHGYTRQYDRHLSYLRDKPIKLLEIGVFRGASLLLWRDVFPKGRIYGLDKNTAIWQKLLRGKDRIEVFVGHQEDAEFLKSTIVPAGPYHVIIDDGGHTPEEQLASFEQLWPHVVPGGIYVIEDMHGNYWEKRAKNGPKMAERLKGMVDDVIGTNDCYEIGSLACYYNIAFIEKNGG